MGVKYIMLLLLAVPLLLSDCTKKIPAYGYVSVMMSAPEVNEDQPVSAVNLDIRSVQVHYVNEAMGNSGWVTLNTNTGIYNMLAYQDEIAAEIATETKLLSGPIDAVKISLGENNTVFVRGEKEYPVSVPERTLLAGLKMHVLVTEGKTLLLALRFDPDVSLATDGLRNFLMRPELGLNLSL